MEKKITVEVELTEKEVSRLMELSGMAGKSIEKIMQSFVSDLTCSSRNHGSDEVDNAFAYYDRALFDMFHHIKRRRSWLQDILITVYPWKGASIIGGILRRAKKIDELKETIAKHPAGMLAREERMLHSLQKNLQDEFDCYIDSTGRKEEDPDANLQDEIKKMQEWMDKYHSILRKDDEE